MFRTSRFALILTLAALAFSQALSVNADDAKMTIKEIMEKAHKGKQSPVQSVIAGKADEATLKQFLVYYESMATQKPPVGDEAGWKVKTAALVDATKGLIDKKPNALATFKTAIDCKGCHTTYKPKK